ncbi:hypothetical protein Poli38472_014632 [Pythium oligandrum]|uniref:E3 ubiquitin-protein ligase CHIP n=1 Tax=Pythium oligandrum TaxID=41045 RepID=A0A8K1CKJ1_PYTOL|nr:hypothetical protein Poli38472_014632 [Pythium oligandrum]|eukprot:TMW63927.1 hypothetical protein Poli38472_014632 [Pythium oligandrum]
MASQERAEALKQKGNACFQKGKFNAAIDMYTEAIVMDPTQTTYYSNRALCHSKLQNWASCRDDCQQALKCDAFNTKASYLLGVSQQHLLAFEDSIAAFKKALHSAEKTKKSKAFQEEILVELRRAKKQQWLRSQETKLKQLDDVKQQLAQLFATQAQVAENRGASKAEMSALDETMAYVERLANKEEQSMQLGDIPEYFICPVSMEIMLDPVTTPNGVSYERHCLEEHLKKNGAVDPLTRQRLTLDMIRPNNSLRSAIQEYLEQHPWAFEH